VTSAPAQPSQFISRRLLLQGSGAALTMGSCALRAADAPSHGLEWASFLERFRPEALALVKEHGLSPASYVRRLSSEILRVRNIPTASLSPIPWMSPAMYFGMLAMGTPFAVVEWRMEPEARQPCHDHPNGSVCTLLLEGELSIENFEIESGAKQFEDGQALSLRRTRMERLIPGRTGVLTPQENNLHRLTAGRSGARGIDLNTVHGATSRFGYVNLPAEPGPDGVAAGRWYDPASAQN